MKLPLRAENGSRSDQVAIQMTEKIEYRIACYMCKQPFDAMEASWCECLSKDRSFTCPSCLKCFCKAPLSFKQKFWIDAPKEMWDRKLKAGQPAIRVNLSVQEIGRPLVLLVEDEPDIRSVAIRAIEGLGYALVVANDGAEGLELAHRYKPELVLSDAFMPKMDGREMCRRIKGESTLARTRVVVMTSLYTATKKYEALKDFRADDFLAKPLDFTQLRETLQKFLS